MDQEKNMKTILFLEMLFSSNFDQHGNVLDNALVKQLLE
jgi:hypothetical protein